MKRHSISRQVLTVVLSIVIIGMALLSVVSYEVARGMIRQSIENEMQLTLSTAVEKMATSLAKNQKVAEMLSRGVEAAGASITESTFEGMLTSFVGTNDETFGGGIWFEPYTADAAQKYFSRYCWRENGSISYVQNYSLGEGVYYTDQDWYSSVANTDGAPKWSSAYYDGFVNISMVTSSVPFYDKNGVFRGVSTTDMDLTKMQELVLALKPDENSSSFLIDSSGTYIANEDAEKQLNATVTGESNASLAALGKTILEQKSGAGSYEADGTHYLVWYTQIPECNWHLAIATPENVLYARLNELAVSLTVICAAIAIVDAIILAIYLRRSIVKPLGHLAQATEQIANGDMNVQISSTANNEIGVVTRSVQKTAERLQDYMRYIDELSDVLTQIAQGNLDYRLKRSNPSSKNRSGSLKSSRISRRRQASRRPPSRR